MKLLDIRHFQQGGVTVKLRERSLLHWPVVSAPGGDTAPWWRAVTGHSPTRDTHIRTVSSGTSILYPGPRRQNITEVEANGDISPFKKSPRQRKKGGWVNWQFQNGPSILETVKLSS